MAKINTAWLKRHGFDESEYDRAAQCLRVRCSQCQALVIQGLPCHERGCPNACTDKRQ